MSELASSQLGKRERLRFLYARWLPVAFFAAALANLVLTSFLPRSALPILGNEDGSLTHLVHNAQPSVDRRFAFYLELGDATDGGQLVVPVDSFVDSDLVEGFADFELVECIFDPSALPQELLVQGPLGEVETESGDIPYFIIPGEGDLWWVAVSDERIVVVPESVAPPPCAAP